MTDSATGIRLVEVSGTPVYGTCGSQQLYQKDDVTPIFDRVRKTFRRLEFHILIPV